ncbi:MAG: hypothetical protein AAGC93_26860 [Cyanobacteria bacterium P01_F01_bin.53]
MKDTGTGIPQQIQNKIFDPFFTTNSIGTEIGFGRSLAYPTYKKSRQYLPALRWPKRHRIHY